MDSVWPTKILYQIFNVYYPIWSIYSIWWGVGPNHWWLGLLDWAILDLTRLISLFLLIGYTSISKRIISLYLNQNIYDTTFKPVEEESIRIEYFLFLPLQRKNSPADLDRIQLCSRPKKGKITMNFLPKKSASVQKRIPKDPLRYRSGWTEALRYRSASVENPLRYRRGFL